MSRGGLKLGAYRCLSVASICAFAHSAVAEEPRAEASSGAQVETAAPGAKSKGDCKLAEPSPARVKIPLEVAPVIEVEKKALRAPLAVAPRPELTLPLVPRDDERAPHVSERWQKSAGLVVGASGVLGLGVAGAFFADAMHKRAEAARQCNAPGACEPKARLSMDAKAAESGNIAAVAAVTGLALAGAGAILYLTAPAPPGMKDLRFSPTFAAGVGGGISAKASF